MIRNLSHEPSMPGTAIIQTALFAQASGVNWVTLANETGLTPADMIEPLRQYPNHIATTLWRLICEANPGEAMTLRMAVGTPPRLLGALSFGSRFARDLRQIFQILIRFSRITLSSTAQVALMPGDVAGESCFVIKNPGLQGEYAMAMPDMRFASSYGVIARDIGLDMPTLTSKIEFGYKPFGPLSAYEDYYQVPVVVREDAAEPYIAHHYLPGALDHPFAQHDTNIFSFVIQQLRTQFRRVLEVGPLDDVRDAVDHNAALGVYSAEEVARFMGKSLRSLQRELKAHEISLRDLIDEARIETASRLLSRQELSLAQIAEQLGYSSTSAFRRAFKRRMALTPTEYRATLRPGRS